ncbi:hypothetical protein HZY62_02025 [Maribacter polysiphoniae]|uniref:Lipocalin-like protein n=1 Tax=Maribacter polysiphoniae TaxID=429344 RepID=A0A316E5W5_9FLAO|nr:hypothetical protein [Maribacter polysiphoniae]MBD1259350.1 hypothetical protein [Maribacter polysiphoniae]PWK24912.1 hypothetical protein LX92_01280 [Maribacter polysiphoniae]
MKKLFSFLAIVGIILASNCSRIPENNDPVIGIWTSLSTLTASDTGKVSTRFEWIFNDAYLGRYHIKENGVVVAKTDFSWKEVDGVYTICYPGLEDKPDDKVTMKDTPEQASLIDEKGNIIAVRE